MACKATSAFSCQGHASSSSFHNQIRKNAKPVMAPPIMPSQSPNESRALTKLLRLSLPALGISLMDPALRLMDTACVGQSTGGTLAQAALVPCTNLLTFAFFLLFGLAQSLTNFFATHPFNWGQTTEDAVAPEGDLRNRQLCIGALTAALECSALLGGSLAVLMCVHADWLLKSVGASGALLESARTYMRICSPGLPFAVMATMIQGSFLGVQNAMLPLKLVTLLAGPINFFGDIFLTIKQGWGIAGVALATTIAQIATCVGFGLALRGTLWWKACQEKCVWRVWSKCMRKDVIKPLFQVALLLTFRAIVAIASIGSVNYFATRLPVQLAASHQVLFQLWWLLSFTTESIGTATQAIVAKEFKINPKGSMAFLHAAVRLALQGSLLVAVLNFSVLHFGVFNHVLSTDPAVISIISGPLAIFTALSQIPMALCVVLDASAVAVGDADQFLKLFALAFVATVSALHLSNLNGFGLIGVWLGMWTFAVFRLIGHFLFSRRLRDLLLPHRNGYVGGGDVAAL